MKLQTKKKKKASRKIKRVQLFPFVSFSDEWNGIFHPMYHESIVAKKKIKTNLCHPISPFQ